MKLLFKKKLINYLALAAVVSLAGCDNRVSSSNTRQIETLNFGGSTSVEKIAKALTQSFEEECQFFNASHNHTGSGDAFKYTQGSEKNSATKLDVGFLSRDLKSETEATATGTSGLVCKDGIVAVINSKNIKVDNLTKDQLITIYSTANIKWSDVTGNAQDTATISRYTRDTASGTRDGFFSAIGYKDAVADDSKLPGAATVTSNGDMIAKIKNDENGIGYISLASLEGSTLTGLKCEGVEASEVTVIDGTYKLSRNFNYITRTAADSTESKWEVLSAFLLYMTSREALTIIASNDGILTSKISEAKTWNQIKNENPTVKELCQ